VTDVAEILIGKLADEFVQKLLAGEAIDVEDYCARHPDLADDIRRIYPVILMLHGDGAASLLESQYRILGDYRIIREIGRGGMGIVYEAEQMSLRRRVALKVLPYAAVLDERQLARFRNEALAAAALKHPHIVGIHDFGSDHSVYFYTMDYVEGYDVGKLISQLRRHGLSFETNGNGFDLKMEPGSAITVDHNAPTRFASDATLSELRSEETEAVNFELSVRSARDKQRYYQTVARMGMQAAEALDFAHEKGILHRDIKPSNLMVDQEGQLLIADFGLARIDGENTLTFTGNLIGTLRYMSPEQSSGKTSNLDRRSDVYSLGVTLYEMLTLRPIYADYDHNESLVKRATEEPTHPRKYDRLIPVDLETIILKAIAINREDRYETTQELADDLKRFLDNEPIHARRQPITKRIWKFIQKNKSLTALLLFSAAVLMLLGMGIVNFGRSQVTPVPQVALGTIPVPLNWTKETSGGEFAGVETGARNGNWEYLYLPIGSTSGEYRPYPKFSKNHQAYTTAGNLSKSWLMRSEMDPGEDGSKSVVAWHAPHSGRIKVYVFFNEIKFAESGEGIRWFIDLKRPDAEIKRIKAKEIAKRTGAHRFEFFEEVTVGDTLYFGIESLTPGLKNSTRYGIEIEYQTLVSPLFSEYQSLTDSADDFVPNAPGGDTGQWRYLYSPDGKRKGNYLTFNTYNEMDECYLVDNAEESAAIGSRWLRPGLKGECPIVAWTSNVTGIINIAGFFRDQDVRAKDPEDTVGWFVDIKSSDQNQKELISGTIYASEAPETDDVDIYVEVHKGDVIYFGIQPQIKPDFDLTVYNFTIYLVAEGLTYDK